jgi:hypothetical protein
MITHVQVKGIANLGAHIFKVVALINFILFCLLIGLLLLFEFLPDSDSSACGGRTFEPLPDWPTKRILNLVYRILLASIAILLSVFVFYTELQSLVARIASSSSSSSTSATPITTSYGGKREKHSKSRRLISQLTIACSSGILIQSIYLVFLVSSGIQNTIATISILLISEVFPSVLLLQQLYPRSTKITSSTSSRRKSQRTPGSMESSKSSNNSFVTETH